MPGENEGGQRQGPAERDGPRTPSAVADGGCGGDAPGAVGPPEQDPAGEGGQRTGAQRQSEEQDDTGLEGGHVLGGGGAEQGPAQAGDGEDLLDGDGAASQPHDDERDLSRQGGQCPAQDGQGEREAAHARGGPGGDPLLRGDRGHGVGYEAAEQATRGKPEGQGRQDEAAEVPPPVGRQPPGVDAHQEQEHRGEQVLGQRGQRRGHRPAPGASAPGQGVTQGGGGKQHRGDEADPEGRSHEGQGHPEGLQGAGADGVAGDPGGAEVAAREAREPVADGAHRPLVQAEALTDGGKDLGGGLTLGGGGAQDRQGRVVAAEPGQEADEGDEGGDGEGP